MGQINPALPVAGSTLNSTADPELITALTQILSVINGGIDSTNIAALLAQAAGVNQAGQTVKGAVNIATSESRTNTAYGTMPTPDQVTGIVLPANGQIAVQYAATWQESVAGTARAAIFIGANQLKVPSDTTAPVTQAAGVQGGATININRPLLTAVHGLVTHENNAAYTGDVTTGQAAAIAPASTSAYHELNGVVQSVMGVGGSLGGFGGLCLIDNLPAGTYTIAVQFKASSGSVTASNRRLRVWAISFA